MAISTAARTRIFISYSHVDRKYSERLQIHLALLARIKKVDFWVDTMIKPGSKWREEIKQAIACAKIAILLLSPDYLASEFITENELPPLLAASKEEGVTIYIVIISPCAVKLTGLDQYEWAHPSSKQLNGMTKNGQDSVWKRLVEQINDILEVS